MTHPSTKSKLDIADAIRDTLKEKNISIRRLSENIGMKHPQVIRILNAGNYNIDTLLTILDGLGLEVVVKKKEKE